MATRILAVGGDDKRLGQLWVANFIQRNPNIASEIGRSVEDEKTENATATGQGFDDRKPEVASPEQVRAFLQLFEETRKTSGIRLADLNEHGNGYSVRICSTMLIIWLKGEDLKKTQRLVMCLND